MARVKLPPPLGTVRVKTAMSPRKIVISVPVWPMFKTAVTSVVINNRILRAQFEVHRARQRERFHVDGARREPGFLDDGDV